MSQIYIKEPPTNGKVLLKTTLGDMDIELWSKEAPLACRNFVQLCMEGYYNGTMFHRIVPDFIAQGGDPTGTGEGGESVYGSTFKDEFHSRLKFNRRGLVGMANGGRDDNSSQFFITLNRADELSGKHTLFGKITGDTLYNMIRLNDVHTDKDGRPLNPVPKILKTKVLSNPFEDIVPRIDSRKLEKRVEKQKVQSRATKNFGLLSFGEEAEDDEEQVTIASKDLKIKSSHDVLTDDPKLSSEPALEMAAPQPKERKGKKKKKRLQAEEDSAVPSPGAASDHSKEGEEEVDDRLFDQRMKEQVQQKLGHVEESWEDELDEFQERVAQRTEKLREESRQLVLEMKQAQKRREEEARQREREAWERENAPDAIKAMRQENKEYRQKKMILKGADREKQTMALLDKFKSRLLATRSTPTDASEPAEQDTAAAGEETQNGESPPNKLTWSGQQIHFGDQEDRVVIAKDANIQNEDTYDISDPRHPLNKRRRAEGEIQAPRKRTKN